MLHLQDYLLELVVLNLELLDLILEFVVVLPVVY